MKRFLCLSALAWGWLTAHPIFAQNLVATTVEEAQADPDFARQGEYAADGVGHAVQVIALGKSRFRAVTFQGGLPGAGWDRTPPKTTEGTWESIQPALNGLKRIERKSPTLGLAAPAGATVLFDGTKETLQKRWKAGATMTDHGLLKPGVTTVDNFGDFTLHVEFLLPYMPDARGQARGNSGCYLQGRYEVQMLDSFGLPVADNECGGLYKAAAPSANLCFPPLTWQTYDIDFSAAKFDNTGKKVSNARVTIRHNGVVIHENQELPEQTPGGTLKTESPAPGPIFLQDHRDPVRYRNIWIVPRA